MSLGDCVQRWLILLLTFDIEKDAGAVFELWFHFRLLSPSLHPVGPAISSFHWCLSCVRQSVFVSPHSSIQSTRWRCQFTSWVVFFFLFLPSTVPYETVLLRRLSGIYDVCVQQFSLSLIMCQRLIFHISDDVWRSRLWSPANLSTVVFCIISSRTVFSSTRQKNVIRQRLCVTLVSSTLVNSAASQHTDVSKLK